MAIITLTIGIAIGIFAGLKFSERREDSMIKEARAVRDENKRLVDSLNEITTEHAFLLRRLARLIEKYGVAE